MAVSPQKSRNARSTFTVAEMRPFPVLCHAKKCESPLDMTRKIRDEMYLETRSMTDNELLEYYSQKILKPEKKIRSKKAA